MPRDADRTNKQEIPYECDIRGHPRRLLSVSVCVYLLPIPVVLCASPVSSVPLWLAFSPPSHLMNRAFSITPYLPRSTTTALKPGGLPRPPNAEAITPTARQHRWGAVRVGSSHPGPPVAFLFSVFDLLCASSVRSVTLWLTSSLRAPAKCSKNTRGPCGPPRPIPPRRPRYIYEAPPQHPNTPPAHPRYIVPPFACPVSMLQVSSSIPPRCRAGQTSPAAPNSAKVHLKCPPSHIDRYFP